MRALWICLTLVCSTLVFTASAPFGTVPAGQAPSSDTQARPLPQESATDGAIPGPVHPSPPAGADDKETASPPPVGMIGVRLYMRNAPCFVRDVLEGGPASTAGVLPADRLLNVNGQPVEGLKMREITGLVKGPLGTEVTLTLKQPASHPETSPSLEGFFPRKRRRFEEQHRRFRV